MKFSEFININSVLQKIGKQTATFKVSYHIAKMIKAMEDDMKFYEERTQAIIDEYGLRNEDGSFVMTNQNGVMIKPECIDECTKQISELNEIEVTTVLPKIKMELLENFEMSAEEAFILQSIIEE